VYAESGSRYRIAIGVIIKIEADNALHRHSRAGAGGGYVAIVPALPGCVSQGDTRDEVLGNIREAADLYIEDCIASGDPVPEEAGKEYFELTTENR
jgi:predicted RNase H-like HicB family nuclease